MSSVRPIPTNDSDASMVEHLGITEAQQCPGGAKLWTACGSRMVGVSELSGAR
jgi:hypothetical protein